MSAPLDPVDPSWVIAQVLPTESHARAALSALREAGWRIVHTERAGYVRTDLHPDESRRLYVGSSPMDGDEWLYRIVDEWTPEGDAQ